MGKCKNCVFWIFIAAGFQGACEKTGDQLTIPEWETLERYLGYGSKWWEKDTVENIKNRGAVRMEHRVHPDET